MPSKTAATKAKAATALAHAGKKGQVAAVKREPSVSSLLSSDDGHVPDDLLCGICHDLLVGARQTPCCGGLSCLECIQAVAHASSICPYCRSGNLSAWGVHPDVRAERMAASVVRRCKYDGCDYSGKRDELAAHVAACDKRPKDDMIAELREAKQQVAAMSSEWARQRCFQISLLRSQVNDPSAWPREIRQQLEHLFCQVHPFANPGVTDSVSVPHTCPLQMKLMPRTCADLQCSAAHAPVIKLSHREDQVKPTTCYIIKAFAPSSARRITIPASASETVVVKDLVTEEQARGVVNVYLAKTLEDFGLGPDGNYALTDVEVGY